MLGAVEQAGVAADHLDVAVAGHARERGIDRDEVEIAIQHRHRLVHAAQHFAGDAAFALGVAAVGDVARGAGDAQRAAIRHRARPRGRARAPRSSRRSSPGTRCSDRNSGVCRAGAGAGGRAPAAGRRDGCGGRIRRRFRRGCRTRCARRPCTRMRCSLVARQVVIPELFARCPQRQLQPFLAIADAGEIIAARGAGAGASAEQQPAPAAPAPAAHRRPAPADAPQRRRDDRSAGAVPAGSRRRRGWCSARGTGNGPPATACR